MRDKLHSPEKAKQPMLFEGMERRYGLSPTDIDAFVEYSCRLFIYFEGKRKGADMLKGQRMSFEHICESYYKPDVFPIKDRKYFAWAIVFEHEVPDEEGVMVKDQYVRKVYSSVNPDWVSPDSDEVIPKFSLDLDGKINVLEAQKQIEDWCRENNIAID